MALINGHTVRAGILRGKRIGIDNLFSGGHTPPIPLRVYGWHVDPSKSDPAQAVTYLVDAVGKTPASMGASTFSYGDWADAFFMPKPCMLKYDGTVDYYLDPNDYTKKADGTASDIADPNYGGNAMMEWPLIWYKFEAGSADGEGYFYCSNTQVDSSYKCWCNYDANDNIIPHFYTAIYNGTGTNKLRSLSGVKLTTGNGSGGTVVDTEVARATANNTTEKVEWYTDVLSDRLLINALMILISKSLNTQTAFGRGLDAGDASDKNNYTTGTLNDKGLFWGNPSNGWNCVKTFGMENWYGCVWRRTAGMIGTSSGYKIKLTYGTADGSTAIGYTAAGTGYIDISNRPTNGGYITKMQFNDKGFFPKVLGGSPSTYWPDNFYEGTRYACFGGCYADGLRAGSFSIDLQTQSWNPQQNISTSLSCKPIRQSN